MNLRFKFRVWDKGNEQYLNLSEVDYLTLDTENGGLIIGFLDELMTEMTYMPEKDMVVEQCTGLKDKNGNLIYEGDVVDYFGEPATIVWDCCGFKIKTNDGICHEFYRNGIEIINNVHKTGIEIIGNIHEQAEQKEIK